MNHNDNDDEDDHDTTIIIKYHDDDEDDDDAHDKSTDLQPSQAYINTLFLYICGSWVSL